MWKEVIGSLFHGHLHPDILNRKRAERADYANRLSGHLYYLLENRCGIQLRFLQRAAKINFILKLLRVVVLFLSFCLNFTPELYQIWTSDDL